VDQDVTASHEEADRAQEMGETLMLGLRLMTGVTWDEFAQRFGADMRALYRPEIAQLAEDGLLTVDARGLRLTRRGHLLGNRVFAAFLP